jgi:hypothetical protein
MQNINISAGLQIARESDERGTDCSAYVRLYTEVYVLK